jgi:hypothetical protein
MKIVVPNECVDFECRVAPPPEVSKKLTDLGHDIVIEKGQVLLLGCPIPLMKLWAPKLQRTLSAISRG